MVPSDLYLNVSIRVFMMIREEDIQNIKNQYNVLLTDTTVLINTAKNGVLLFGMTVDDFVFRTLNTIFKRIEDKYRSENIQLKGNAGFFFNDNHAKKPLKDQIEAFASAVFPFFKKFRILHPGKMTIEELYYFIETCVFDPIYHSLQNVETKKRLLALCGSDIKTATLQQKIIETFLLKLCLDNYNYLQFWFAKKEEPERQKARMAGVSATINQTFVMRNFLHSSKMQQ